MSFFVTCKDSGGKRVPIGGAHVEVQYLLCMLIVTLHLRLT